MNRTDLDHRLARIREVLVVAAGAAIATNPGERSLHHPALRQWDVSHRSLGAWDHLDLVAGFGSLQPFGQRVIAVLLIIPESLQPTDVLDRQLSQHHGGRRPIIGRGRRDGHSQEQTQRIHDDMPFSPGDLLAPVVAPFATDFGPLDGLAVDAADAGGGLAAGLAAYLL